MLAASDLPTTLDLDSTLATLANFTSTVTPQTTAAPANDTGVDRHPQPHTAGYYTALVAMATVILTAVGGNVCNMVVIMRSSQLRHSLSNFFVVSLCTSDLLAATLVMPVAAFTFALGDWPLDDAACSVAGFVTSLFMFVSTTTLSVISVERYYSIRMPMHHAAHMSVGKTVAALVLMWSWAGALAALPLLGMGSYEFRHRRYHCFFSWHKVYVGLVVTLCFVLPGLVLMAMYFGIFRVARQAATQVRPVPSDVLRSSTTSASVLFTKTSGDHPFPHQPGSSSAGHPATSPRSAAAAILPTMELTSTTSEAEEVRNAGPKSDSESHAKDAMFVALSRLGRREAEKRGAECTDSAATKSRTSRPCKSRRFGSAEDSGIASQGSGTVAAGEEGMMLRVNTLRPLQGHLKAAKTLLLLLLAYVALWGPFFILHLHAVSQGLLEASWELLALWLGFVSFAVNPFLYGWMNKAIREELVALCRRLCCRWQCCSRCSPETAEDMLQSPSDEDFLQFLERTSQVPTVSSGRKGRNCQDTRPEMSEVNIDSSDPF